MCGSLSANIRGPGSKETAACDLSRLRFRAAHNERQAGAETPPRAWDCISLIRNGAENPNGPVVVFSSPRHRVAIGPDRSAQSRTPCRRSRSSRREGIGYPRTVTAWKRGASQPHLYIQQFTANVTSHGEDVFGPRWMHRMLRLRSPLSIARKKPFDLRKQRFWVEVDTDVTWRSPRDRLERGIVRSSATG
jgi:hypothetical protein